MAGKAVPPRDGVSTHSTLGVSCLPTVFGIVLLRWLLPTILYSLVSIVVWSQSIMYLFCSVGCNATFLTSIVFYKACYEYEINCSIIADFFFNFYIQNYFFLPFFGLENQIQALHKLGKCSVITHILSPCQIFYNEYTLIFVQNNLVSFLSPQWKYSDSITLLPSLDSI